MLYLVPLEKLSQRYTEMMDREIQKSLRKVGKNFEAIYGNELTKSIEIGAFLDANGTCYYKATQLQKIATLFQKKKIKNGDKFLIYDLWFPGIEMIKYMAYFNNLDVKIYGIAHAGSWTPTDFVAKLKNWASFNEMGWLTLMDKVFVGSKHHKNELVRSFDEDGRFMGVRPLDEKVIVTGLPFDSKEVLREEVKSKQRIVTFVGRPHWEKGIEEFLRMAWEIGQEDEKVIFWITADCGKEGKTDKKYIDRFYETAKMFLGDRLIWKGFINKKNYFKHLWKTKVVYSYARQENYGYGCLEAVVAKCNIVVPDMLSYVELYPKKWRMDSLIDSIALVKKGLDSPFDKDLQKKIRWCNKSADRIVQEVCK